MIIDNNNNITIVTQEKASIVELVKKLQVVYSRYQNNNIIINLTSLGAITKNDVVEFLEISTQHKGAGHSFVLVSNKIEHENVPEKLIIVPTLQEAFDIIEMEEIERDLGF